MTTTDIERRNNRLIKFFENNFPKLNIATNCSDDKPAVILIGENEKKCLSCYVSNFYLIFTDMPFKGNKLFEIKLTEENVTKLLDFDKEMVNEWILNYLHRDVFFVYAKFINDICFSENSHNKLFLTGFQKDKNDRLFPVLSEIKQKIYFSREKACEIAETYSTELVVLNVL